MNKYHLINAREISQSIIRTPVQTIITSPPYFDLKNYGPENQIGWGQDYEKYIDDLIAVFSHCHDIASIDGTMWIVLDTYKSKGVLQLLPFEILRNIEKSTGWVPQDIIIWNKVKNLPYSRAGQFRNNFEYILLFSKSDKFKYHVDSIREIDNIKEWWIKYPERYNPMGKVPTNIWNIQIPTQGSWGNGSIKHLCPFPYKLVERMIDLSTDEGDLVLDPFAGSGIVLAAAKVMGRNYMGFDINEEYVQRFSTHVLPDIENLWEGFEGERKERDRRQKALKKYILTLRMLKYGKVLLQRSIKSDSVNIIDFIVVDMEGRSKSNEFSVNIYLKERSAIVRNTLLNILLDLAKRKPLSKYGLTSNINVLQPKRRILGELEYKNYIFYRNGRFYEINTDTEITAVEKWEKDKYPPIFSNLKVSKELIEQAGLPYPTKTSNKTA